MTISPYQKSFIGWVAEGKGQNSAEKQKRTIVVTLKNISIQNHCNGQTSMKPNNVILVNSVLQALHLLCEASQWSHNIFELSTLDWIESIFSSEDLMIALRIYIITLWMLV